MKRLLFSLLPPIFFVAGALLATPLLAKKLPKPESYDYAIDFVNSLHQATNRGWGKWIKKVERNEQIKKGFQTLEVWWCPNHKKINTTQSVYQQIARFCGRKGGKMDKAFDQQVYGSFCRSNSDSRRALFYTRVWNSWHCRDRNQTAHVILIEPTKSDFNPAYIARLKKLGYKPNQVVRLPMRTDSTQQTASNSMAPARPFKRKLEIGMQICKREQGKRFKGFVERIHNQRVKITIAQVFSQGGQLLNDPRQPKIIWDLSKKWMACEK